MNVTPCVCEALLSQNILSYHQELPSMQMLFFLWGRMAVHARGANRCGDVLCFSGGLVWVSPPANCESLF
jgi:hypothetical protein